MSTTTYSHPCEFYLLCDNQTTEATAHPVLWLVPTCRRCADKHQLNTVPLPQDWKTQRERHGR